jgi:hypothetical protein
MVFGMGLGLVFWSLAHADLDAVMQACRDAAVP